MIVIVKLHRHRRSPNSGHVTFPFECAFPDIPALEEALKRGERVNGNDIVYNRVGEESVITKRRPFQLVDAEVHSIQMPFREFQEMA